MRLDLLLLTIKIAKQSDLTPKLALLTAKIANKAT